jgi:hypothetical protein
MLFFWRTRMTKPIESNYNSHVAYCYDLEKYCDEQTAYIEGLRQAINLVVFENLFVPAIAILAKTPSQSLQDYRNKVLDEASMVCNTRAANHASATRENEADACAIAIRDLQKLV